MNDQIRCFANCHHCKQTNQVSINAKTYSCKFCHYPNNNPFFIETDERKIMRPKSSTKFNNVVHILRQYGKDFSTKDIIKRYRIDFKEDISKTHVNRIKRSYNRKLKNIEKKKQESHAPAPAPARKKKAFWEIEIDCVTACSKVQDTAEIRVMPLVKTKVQYLMDKFKGIEWLAYLLGSSKLKNGEISWTINDIHIPSQKVSSGNVWDVDCPEYNKLPIIGVIHSHHGMGNSFSKTDHDFINENHDISLIMSDSGLAGQVRIETPCKSVKILNSKQTKGCIKIVHVVDESVTEEFEKQIKKIDTGGRKKNEKEIKKKQAELTEAQKTYANGSSVKELVKKREDNVWDSGLGLMNCPQCSALIDEGNECPYCHWGDI
jgi:hypothetical protein